MKKLGAAAVMAAMTIVVAALCGVALADDGHAKPDKPAPPPKAAKAPDVKQQDSKPESAPKPSEPEAKVYICHATGSQSNPYVLIHVSSHALPAHTKHQDGRDIVLGSSPGTCPGASTSSDVKAAAQSEGPAQTVSFCDMETATTGKFETKDANEVVKHELDGKPEEARDIVPTFTLNGQTYSQNFDANGQAIVAAHCNQATESSVQGAEATSCTDADNDQGDVEKAKQHDDHGKGDDKNGVDRDQKAFKAKHEDNDDDNCPPAPASSSSSTSNTSNSSTASTSSSTSSNTSATESSSTTSNTASTSSNTASTSSNSSNTATSNAESVPASNASPVGENANAGVLGAVKALSAPAAPVLAAKPHANAGVLGTLAKLSNAATSGTLPFSGIRLWIFELIALGLIGLGVTTRMIVRRRPN